MANQNKIKYYKATGFFQDSNGKVGFTRLMRAVTPEDVKEKICLQLGSKHHVRRQLISFTGIEEISENDFDDSNIKFYSSEENFQFIRG